MEARATWQALQARLTAARDALMRGDRDAALAEIDAALEIDPQFLAALSLREWILASQAAPPAPIPRAKVDRSEPEEHGSDERSIICPADDGVVPEADSGAMAASEKRPLTFEDGYVSFEQRAKRRRIARKLEAARTALAARQPTPAAAALDELNELDPDLPDLPALAAQLDDLRRTKRTWRPGARVAAAAAFALTALGASWLQESTSLMSRPIVTSAPLVLSPIPAATPSSEPIADVAAGPDLGDTIATSPAPGREQRVTVVTGTVVAHEARDSIATSSAVGRESRDTVATGTAAGREPQGTVAIGTTPLNTVGTAPSNSRPLTPLPAPVSTAATAEVMPQPELAVVAAPPPAVPQESPVPVAPQPVRSVALREPDAAAPIAPLTVAPVRDIADEDSLVKQTLQRYRRAYEGLDAQSAHAVWPAVNQAALARAFDGLESQTLVFDTCDVRVRGDSATATCHGSARYVPKIGSREMRVEPRVWSFALRKNAGDWTIDSARAER